MATRKKLPNLKICVDNTQSSDESDVGIEDSDSSSSEDDDAVKGGSVRTRGGLEDGEVHEDDIKDVLSIGPSEPTERRFLSRSSLRQTQPVYGPRIYVNKAGDFVTGIDMTCEDASEKIEKRAQRFGTLSTPKQPITDVDIKNIYRSLGINADTLEQDPRGWRTDAILLRGTENMSTRDVFDYFSEYAPKGVEWIDDFSCNVLWQDKLTPARALLKLSRSMEEVLPPTDKALERRKESFQGVSPLNRNKDLPETVPQFNKNTESAPAPNTASVTEPSVPDTPACGSEDPSSQPKQVRVEPVLDVMEEEKMELDYDDNLDLVGEDPIDQAMATWANFSQNKKIRAEKEAQLAVKKQPVIQEEGGRLSEKEVIVIKEENDSARVGSSRKVSEKGQSLNSKHKKKNFAQSMELEAEDRQSNSRPFHEKSRLSKDGKNPTSKDTQSKRKRSEKMDTSNDSDSDSSDSSDSSSSDSGSSSSGSSSSSESDSDSRSESSSSSSAGSSKKQQRKSVGERDKEAAKKKAVRKAAAPPTLPPAREKADIPWPPGWWRLGVDHPKAEYLFMRYAMKVDKKLPGAEKRSEYYKKYGNPNFGGIVGLISNTRKRKIRNLEYRENQDSADEVSASVPSKLAGRIGARGAVGGGGRGSDGGKEEEEEEGEVPVLKEGTDLRDLLNREVSAIKSADADETESRKDTDDEMDYSAELERLMGDNGPPAKKRFMRMHADDEEEKIMARRLKEDSRKKANRWASQNLSNNEDDDDDYYEHDDKEEENLQPSRRKEWVDFDNVEDDDPFNLFGTSRQKQNLTRSSFDDKDENVDYRRTSRREQEESNNDYRSRDVKQRLGGLDLRAKIQSLKRVSNRNW